MHDGRVNPMLGMRAERPAETERSQGNQTACMSVSSTDKGLLTPENCVVIFIGDPQQMSGEATGGQKQEAFRKALVLAKAAKIFRVPVVLCGEIAEELKGMFPEAIRQEGTSMNVWEDSEMVKAVGQTGRRNLVLAAWGNEVCLLMPALQALTDGYGVYVVADACGGTDGERAAAIRRSEQAGAVSVSAWQVLLEFQRDWAGEHAVEVRAVINECGGGSKPAKQPED